MKADRLEDVVESEIAHFFRDGATSWDFPELAQVIGARLRAEGFVLLAKPPQIVYGIAPQDVAKGSLVRIELQENPPPERELSEAEERAVLDDAGGAMCGTCGHSHAAHLHPSLHTEIGCLADLGGCRCNGWT